jgi:hypothetical protein
MFEFLKRWFGNKPDMPAADMNPVTAAALTTDASADPKRSKKPDDSSDADHGDDSDASDSDFDADI